MSNPETGSTCRTLSWLAGALLGILAFLFAWKSFEWGAIIALIFGVIVFFAAGWVLIRLFCISGRAETEGNRARAAEAARPAAAPEKKVAAVEPISAATKAKAAAREPAPTPAPEPAPKAAPKAEPAPAQADAAAGDTPPRLQSPRGGKPDDLKRIKGIGPGLEKLLNDMGIFHFDQIATWSGAEIAWVDDNLLRFKGRASRDDWVSQAKTLAAGGDTEFSQKVDKGSVY